MKKPDFAQTIGILANIGVVAGIAVLIVEIDQNNDALAFQARTMLTVARSAQQEAIVENAGGIVDIIHKACRGESLTWAESYRLNVFHSNYVRTIEAQYREVLAGSLTEDEIPIAQWRAALGGTYGVRDWFNRNAEEGDLDPEFVRFVREVVQLDRAPSRRTDRC
jgi:hypothetical protein